MATHDVPIGANQVGLAQLNERSREIFRRMVRLSYYRRSGGLAQPFAHHPDDAVAGLRPQCHVGPRAAWPRLRAAHVGRAAADRIGTSLFRRRADAVGDLTDVDRKAIEAQAAASGQAKSVETVLTEASGLLSGLTRTAGVVLTAKSNVRLKHVEFVRLEPERALVVLVAEDGQVENRVLELPVGLPTSALSEATNFLNAHIRGRTLAEAKAEAERALDARQAELDALTQKVVSAGSRAGRAARATSAS